MKNKIIIPLMLIASISCFTACNTRATPNTKNDILITEVGEIEEKNIYFPKSITLSEENGEKVLTKKFEVPKSVNPYDLVEEPFIRNKYEYSAQDIVKYDSKIEYDVKLVSSQVVLKSTSNDINKILKQAPIIIDYDKDGYKGQLMLNTNNVLTESIGTKTYSYTISDTKTYTGLSRNDTSYIDKSINKNGKELSLVDIEWQPTGTTLVGNTLVPSSYDAVAYYSGTSYGSKSTGYETTLTYVGEVKKIAEENSIIEIIYYGSRVVNYVWITTGIVIMIIGLGLLVFLKKKKENKSEKENSDIAKDRVQDAIIVDNSEKQSENVKANQKNKKDKVTVYVQKSESGDADEKQT